METIKSLKNIPFTTLFTAFEKAFSDYEMQLNSKELQTMLNRRGFIPELSFGAFEGNEIIAFTFNGIGNYNGVKTAYDTGTGTLKEYRGKGLASSVFIYSIPYLKKAGIKQYLLEVLQHNTKAFSVYKKLGFEVSREFNYFTQNNEGISLISKDVAGIYFKQTGLSGKESMSTFWDFTPSWQNSFEAIERNPGDFIIMGAFMNKVLVGYCIFEPNSGDITQLAVEKEHRRKGIATNLLKDALKLNSHNSVKAINTEINCQSITKFLESNGISLQGKQFEMIKKL